MLRKAWATRRSAIPGHWATAQTENLLGGCSTKLGRYDEAEPRLLDSFPTLASTPGVPPARVLQARTWIVALYDAWGKPEEATRWRLKLRDFDFPADPFAR